MGRLPSATIFIIVVCFAVPVWATVDFCLVNHFTEECALVESGGLTDFYEPLGWEPCGCGERCPPIDQLCNELGYTYRGRRPSYKIEALLAVLLLAGVTVVVVVKMRRGRMNGARAK